MQARVVERADLVGRGAHDDERPVGDLVDERVADLGELLLAARHLPDAVPHPLDLEAMELGIEVSLARMSASRADGDVARRLSGTGRVSVSSSDW